MSKNRSKPWDKFFSFLGIFCVLFGLLVLIVLFVDVFIDGWKRLSWDFLTSFPSRKAERAGILAAWVGTVSCIVIVAMTTFIIGIGAAIYLEEYAKKSRLKSLIEVNISNLAGLPSIIYGLLGLVVFVRWFNFERSILSGGLTLSLLVLPVVIVAARESLKSVPFSIREASYALGATKWQTVWMQVLPASFGGILTGMILAVSRAIGEAAPLITIGALTYIAFLPKSPFDPFTAMPIQIFNWVSRPQKDFHENAAAGIIILLAITLLLNFIAIYLRYKRERSFRW